jgi:hypothetical protein
MNVDPLQPFCPADFGQMIAGCDDGDGQYHSWIDPATGPAVVSPVLFNR